MNNKLNNILLTTYLLLFQIVLFAQSTESQSPKHGLTYEEQVKIDSLCQYSSQIRFTSPDTAILVGEEALALAKKYNYEDGLGKSLENLGGAYWIESHYIKAFDYYFQALKIRERQGKRKASAKLLDNIGLMFESREMYGKAYENFEKALGIYQKLGDDEGVAEALSYMGDNLSQQHRHEQGLEMLLKALKVREYLGNKKEISRSLNVLGIAYERHGELDRAIDYFNRSLAIKEDINDLRGMGYNLNYLGDLAVKKKEYNKAVDLYKRSIKYKVMLKDNYGKLFSLLGLAKVYEKKHYYPGVVNYGLQSYYLARVLHSVNEIKEVAELLATVYEKQEAYKRALFFQKVALEYSSKISDASNVKELEALKYRYEMDRKNTENELLRKNNQLRQQKLLANQIKMDEQKSTIFMISLLTVCLLLVLFLLFNYSRAKRRNNLAIQKINEELEQKVFERTQQWQAQNKKLVDYAFFNAHKVRGPLARILGLINIMRMEFNDPETIRFTDMLSKSAEELNEVVSQINRILEEEGAAYLDEQD